MVKVQPFYLLRKIDPTGISGVGVVAQGVILSSGRCIIEWTSFHTSINIYNSLDAIKELHGHNGDTEIILGYPDDKLKKKPVKKKLDK